MNTLPEITVPNRGLSPLIISGLIHLGLAALIAAVLLPVWSSPVTKTAEFEVYEMPKASSQAVSLLRKPKEKPQVQEKKHAVFGASRNSITSSDGIEVKAGNTVAKAPDQETLKPGDSVSLPVPVDEYLVSQMPKLLTEVRIPYPPEAKKTGIQGPVIMNILVDAAGQVREAQLIEGPGFGLNEAAVAAVKNFKFAPAQVDQKPVAVRFRYSYRFVLER
ncbi:MAG: energy transducer TonB [Methylotenera sp.]|nr:energy transducer TonB [Oligoflexia bacterium]